LATERRYWRKRRTRRWRRYLGSGHARPAFG
jgi:hypothetical protein